MSEFGIISYVGVVCKCTACIRMCIRDNVYVSVPLSLPALWLCAVRQLVLCN